VTEKQHRIYPPILAHARELRQPQTPAESKLWTCLRNRQLGGFKFRRQHPIDRFIVDFYCAACRLVVETDGDSHADQVEYDAARTAWLNEQGYCVIRFCNRDVHRNIDAVLEVILAECQKLSPPSPPAPLPGRERGASPSPLAPLPGRERGASPSPPALLPGRERGASPSPPAPLPGRERGERAPSPRRGEGWGEGRSSLLGELDISPQQALQLTGRERSRLLNFLLRWERVEEAHACLDVLTPANPTLVSLLDLRAKAFLAQNRPDDALAVMEERLRLRTSLTARSLLARVHLARGDMEAAHHIARALVEERDDSITAWGLLGEVALARGETEAALAAYRRVSELRPYSRAYLLGMVAFYQASGDHVTASACCAPSPMKRLCPSFTCAGCATTSGPARRRPASLTWRLNCRTVTRMNWPTCELSFL